MPQGVDDNEPLESPAPPSAPAGPPPPAPPGPPPAAPTPPSHYTPFNLPASPTPPGGPPAAPPPPPPLAAPLPPGGPEGPQATPATTAAPERGRRRIALPVAIVALTLTSGFAGAAAATALTDDDKAPPAASSLDTPTKPVSDNTKTGQEPLADAAKKVLPSVVSIVATDGRQTGEGSGVIISSDGLILTNNHVVEMAADGGKLTVTLPDGSKEQATIKGRDTASDLAVIEVKGHTNLTPATFGKSSDLDVGETVLAVGSPLGLEGSVTSGIVSALDRAITLGSEQQQSQQSASAVVDAIQTDAAINPGNSGGPLVNTDGNVVGINTAIASLSDQSQFGGGNQSGSIGVGFAIPIDEARTIADQLVNKGQATHAYLGVRLTDTDNGVQIAGIESNSPAGKAGLKEGDIVTKLGDAKVDDVASLTAKIRAHKPGDKVTITVKRDGKTQTADVILGTYPTANS